MQKFITYKIYIIIFFIIGSAVSSKSQDCKTLDSLNSFHKLKFGSPMPDSLSKICFHGKNYYSLTYDKLKDNNRKLYSDIFIFINQLFSTLFIEVSGKEEIFSIHLWSKLDYMDSIDIENNKLPYKFLRLNNTLISLFGNSTRIEEKNNPITADVFGITTKYIWECENIRLALRLTSGSKSKALNIIGIEITEKNLEKQEILRRLKN